MDYPLNVSNPGNWVTSAADMPSPLSLFAAYGIEIEYMIVDRQHLNVLPITDKLIYEVAGEYLNEIEHTEVAWSNELVLHVVEIKTNGPAKSLAAVAEHFQNNLHSIQAILDNMDARLMPTAMHPWMNPFLETTLWPHGQTEIYDTYNRIFNCEGHGWSNLQSMHINLPFANNREFARLHSAIRILLPVLPAIAASSPIVEASFTGMMDTRLETYRQNSKKIPSITGLVIPEPVTTKEAYRKLILNPMYKDIAPFDPDNILQDEWLNSRGAIARFDRNAIEIRVLDTQEMPLVDLSIATFIVEVLKKITDRNWSEVKQQNEIDTEALAAILSEVIINADKAFIDNRDYLRLFNFPDKKCSAQDLWQYLGESVNLETSECPAKTREIINFILKHGPLSRRIINATGTRFRKSRLFETYRVLCDCLMDGEMFVGID